MGDRAGEPIAIIGMGCRFPGAQSPAEFWRLSRDGVDAIIEVPSDRFDIDAYYDPVPGVPGKTSTRWGGFIRDVDRFDAAFFGIAPREVEVLDPQQRVLLEVTWEALEEAGVPLEQIAGSNTGVFIGISHTDYSDLQCALGLDPGAYYGTGQSHSLAANRLSYIFDLHGPSLAIDTACSSSLVAAHLACGSLRRNECDLALVGGVNLILTPLRTIAYSQAHMLSSDGRCKAFDASADGYVRSDGCGVIVLKRLSTAIRDGDPVTAVILGTATNEDGQTSGVMVPNARAQEAVIRDALSDARLQPADIGYVEAHGTGTPVGDPLEVDALKAVLTQDRALDRPCIIGSAKTNIGHTEPAAGIAGIIRAALILQHREVPPHLHLKQLNPAIDLEGTPLRIVRELTLLEGAGRPLHAGINSFGFGGTNAHVILAVGPVVKPIVAEIEAPSPPLLISARSEAALHALARDWRAVIADAPAERVPLLMRAAARRRDQH
ncbi:MAG TPA: beta-ketoacyl synthase N-terminal-like domain-containing protein, partial [Chloroflexota bacterium]